MADESLAALSAIDAVAEMARGAFSAEEYTRACLDRIAAVEDAVKAFAHLDPEHAIAQARERDAWRETGRAIGPLHGVPVGIKDIFDTEDYPTECGSPLMAGRRPRDDAAAVAKLRQAGAVIIGKTVTTEFAYYHPGATRNPHDVERTPGGSSSGSAAAVAAGMVPLAIGSQTNGSMIRPAAFCGVYGCKPTHGTISRHGALILSRALDHVGVFARSVADCALMLDVISGYDARDRDTRRTAAPACLETAAQEPPMPPRFAFVRTPMWEKADAACRAAFEELAASLGERTRVVDMPDSYAAAWQDHRVIMAADMAHNLGAIVERGGEASSKALRDFLAEGSQVAAVRYLAARAAAPLYAAGLDEVFKEFDAIITPATSGVAPKGEATGSPMFCTLWTLIGLPAITLPMLQGEGGMPLGVQLIGERGDDARLLRTANWLVENLSD